MKYCKIAGIDVCYFSDSVRDAMEREMKENITTKVLAVHSYKLPTADDYAEKGRDKTRVKEGDRLKTIWARSEDEMIQKLYKFYFQDIDKYTMNTIWNQLINDNADAKKVLPKTIKDYCFDYNRFFKNDVIATMDIRKISVSDMAKFLDRAHTKVSDLDIKRGKDVIEKHRHSAIRTIINYLYNYANVYLDLNLTNPINSVSYNSWSFYDQSKLTHEWYTKEARLKLYEAFDNIESPSLEICCAAFILETTTRNSEARAIKFNDFFFNTPVPFVFISCMADGNNRDNRIKADSPTGKRAVPLTPRLLRIYQIAKEKSWSSEFLFVQDYEKWNYKDDGIIRSQGLQRGLKKLCELAGVNYLPPHQIRFSDATIMAMEGADMSQIQSRLGHTTPDMANHYIRQAKQYVPAAGPNWTKIPEDMKKAPNTDKSMLEAISNECPEPESNQ